MILIIKYVAIAVIAYLLGAIPFGLIISKKLSSVDIRKYGSGNIGGTNVLRVLGKRLGLLTILLDMSKAALSVLIGMWLIGDETLLLAGMEMHIQVAQVIAALMAVVGHNWSVYIKFKGGKGVAAGLGGLMVINWVIGLIALAVFLIVMLTTKYVSVGSISGSVAVLLAFIVLTLLNKSVLVYIVYGLLFVVMVIYQHRSNIARLCSGTENRIGDKKSRVAS